MFSVKSRFGILGCLDTGYGFGLEKFLNVVVTRKARDYCG
jgi:hypothetical protein